MAGIPLKSTVHLKDEKIRRLEKENVSLRQQDVDLDQFFRDKKLCDFTVHVGDKQIPVHKVIIAGGSPVFAAMLEPHTEEAKNNYVRVDDIDVDVVQVCCIICKIQSNN